jgi:hypothetical protein
MIVAFESHGGRLEPFDDGHIPETFGCISEEDVPRIVRYDSSTANKTDVHIYDGVLDSNHACMLYNVTSGGRATLDTQADVRGESPWGTYVTIKEAMDWIEWKKVTSDCSMECNNNCYEAYLMHWKQKITNFCKWRQQNEKKTATDEKKEEQTTTSSSSEAIAVDIDSIRHLLAVEAVAQFFLETIPNQSGTITVASNSNVSPTEQLYQLPQFLQQTHGVAVWALSSQPGHSVLYHIDYAELLRYEYNVTVPPLWAGTIQCSALWNEQAQANKGRFMKGGEFCVNTRGLDHYAEHGYKGTLSGDVSGGWKRIDVTSIYGVHLDEATEWVTIPYAFNRGIVHRGDLPHLSAPVEHIEECSSQVSRVIVGFNVFGHDVGELVSKAPEHSRAFRRKVKLYRATMTNGNNASKDPTKDNQSNVSKGGMYISQIRKNKALTKLLVLAKREKVKEELRRNQEQLSYRIWQRLLQHQRLDSKPLTVSDIVEEFGRADAWPNLNDVHVHLHHVISSVKGREDLHPTRCFHDDTKGIAGVSGARYMLVPLLDEHERGGMIPLSTQLVLVLSNQELPTLKIAR